MSLSSKIAGMFPTFQIVIILFSFLNFGHYPTFESLFILVSAIYLLPLLCFRLFSLFFPLKEGVSNILEKGTNPWWVGHQIQLLFITLPWLEGILRMIPGCYSLWLRCWGSKVGKGIYWTPGVVICDRNLMNIGDGVIFGELSSFYCHVITPKDGKALLMVGRIEIGSKTFVGAGSVTGPGVKISPNAFIGAGALIGAEAQILEGAHVKSSQKVMPKEVIEPRKNN